MVTIRSKFKSRSHHDVARLQPQSNVPTNYQIPTLYGFRYIARTKFERSRSLQQDQRSNQGHAMTLHTYTPSICPYQVSTSETLQLPRYSPTRHYRPRLLWQGQRLNQGYTITQHTYNPQPMFLPNMNFLHLTVSEI